MLLCKFNASSRGSRYKLIFSSLEVIELLSQPAAAHITIIKIIFTKFYYKTIFTKLDFQENYFALAENAVFCTQLIWMWLTKDHVFREKREKATVLIEHFQHKTQKKGKMNISNINKNFSFKFFLRPTSTSNLYIH